MAPFPDFLSLIKHHSKQDPSQSTFTLHLDLLDRYLKMKRSQRNILHTIQAPQKTQFVWNFIFEKGLWAALNCWSKLWSDRYSTWFMSIQRNSVLSFKGAIKESKIYFTGNYITNSIIKTSYVRDLAVQYVASAWPRQPIFKNCRVPFLEIVLSSRSELFQQAMS